MWFFPTLIPGSTVALLFVSGAFYPQTGLADTILRALGFHTPMEGWLDTPHYALIALMITVVWAICGFPMLLLSAAIERIPTEINEAAEVDGAGRMTIARRITLPIIRPVFGMVFALQVIGLLKAFDIIYVMTSGGPGTSTTTLAYAMYENAFIGQSSGLASAYAVVMIVLIVPIGLLARGLVRPEED